MFIGASAIATVGLLGAMPGPIEARVAAMAWCACVSVHAWRRVRRARSVRIEGASIVVDAIQGRIVDGSFVAPWLTIVHWKPQGARFSRTLLVLPDAIDAAAFRALRVILRWSAGR